VLHELPECPLRHLLDKYASEGKHPIVVLPLGAEIRLVREIVADLDDIFSAGKDGAILANHLVRQWGEPEQWESKSLTVISWLTAGLFFVWNDGK
jgi:hypothetical protein